MKVFFTRKIPVQAEKVFNEAGIEYEVFPEKRGIKREELIKMASGCDGIISLLSDKIDREVIDSLPDLKVIANYAVGFNNIDVKHAASKNIIVTNTPDILTRATAEIAISLMLACSRHIVKAEKFMRDGKFSGWEPELFTGPELYGKTLGIAGAGRIGFETARMAKAFGMEIIYYNRSSKTDFENELKAEKVDFNELLKKSDVVSFHLPLTPETNLLLNRENIHYLKKGAIIINTARGEIIDEEVLIEKLKSGEIYSAGLDVYTNEPAVNNELFNTPNLVMLPHIGSATTEARNKMAWLCATNVVKVLKKEPPLTPVI